MNEENSKLRNHTTLIIIITIFCVPFILSWWFLNYTDMVEKGSKSNHGDLIIPARPLPDLELVDPLREERKGKLHGKWNFLYIVKNDCEQSCKNNLYRMRQLRLTAGKDDHRVQRVLLFAESNHYLLKEIFTGFAGQWVTATNDIDMDELLENFRLTEDDQPELMQRLYIIDPLGNLIMSYPHNAEPSGIIKDLKKLLKNSMIG